MDEVFKRGILKNPPVFGSTLEELHRTDFPQVVPRFVDKCIAALESGDKLKTDGVYRQGGNICTIQKIRLEVDQAGPLFSDTLLVFSALLHASTMSQTIPDIHGYSQIFPVSEGMSF